MRALLLGTLSACAMGVGSAAASDILTISGIIGDPNDPYDFGTVLQPDGSITYLVDLINLNGINLPIRAPQQSSATLFENFKIELDTTGQLYSSPVFNQTLFVRISEVELVAVCTSDPNSIDCTYPPGSALGLGDYTSIFPSFEASVASSGQSVSYDYVAATCDQRTIYAGCVYEADIDDVGGFFTQASAGQRYSFSVIELPEPATWAMMLTGFGGAGAMLRRRRAGSFTA